MRGVDREGQGVSAAALWFGWGVGWEWEGGLAGVFVHVCKCRKPARRGTSSGTAGDVSSSGWCLAKSASWIDTGSWCGWDVALVQDAGECVCAGAVVVEDVGWLRLGDGRNGAGASRRLFAHGEGRSAGAKYAGTAGEASGRASGFNHIEGLQSRSFWGGLWLRFSAHVDNCRKPVGRATSSGTAGEVCPSGWS